MQTFERDGPVRRRVGPARHVAPWRKKTGQFDPGQDCIKVMTLHVSKGLEFPVVALVGMGHMPAPGDDECEESKLFCVGAKRATQRLIIGMRGEGRFEH